MVSHQILTIFLGIAALFSIFLIYQKQPFKVWLVWNTTSRIGQPACYRMEVDPSCSYDASALLRYIPKKKENTGRKVNEVASCDNCGTYLSIVEGKLKIHCHFCILLQSCPVWSFHYLLAKVIRRWKASKAKDCVLYRAAEKKDITCMLRTVLVSWDESDLRGLMASFHFNELHYHLGFQ